MLFGALVLVALAGCKSSAAEGKPSASAISASSTEVETSMPTVPAVTTPVQSSAAVSTAPQRYSSTTGRFAVMMPGAYNELQKNDGERTWHEVQSKVGLYSVHYADFKDAIAARAYLEEYAHWLRTNKMHLDQPITRNQVTGRDLAVKVSDTTIMWVRVFIDGARLYKVSAGGTAAEEAKATAFLDTFQLQ